MDAQISSLSNKYSNELVQFAIPFHFNTDKKFKVKETAGKVKGPQVLNLHSWRVILKQRTNNYPVAIKTKIWLSNFTFSTSYDSHSNDEIAPTML